MEREELGIRIALASRLTMLIPIVLAIYNMSMKAREAGTLCFLGWISFFVIGICMIIATYFLLNRNNNLPSFFERATSLRFGKKK